MREIRLYGSEGGETGQPVFPTPITHLRRTGPVARSRGGERVHLRRKGGYTTRPSFGWEGVPPRVFHGSGETGTLGSLKS